MGCGHTELMTALFALGILSKLPTLKSIRLGLGMSAEDAKRGIFAALFIVILATPLAYADDMSDMANWCATQATAPSSLIICSDFELRRLAVVRNKIFEDARAVLAEDDMRELSAEQNRWIHDYTAKCGAPVNGPPLRLPVSQEVIDCYKKAARERVAKLVKDLRDIIPNYREPAITGLPP